MIRVLSVLLPVTTALLSIDAPACTGAIQSVTIDVNEDTFVSEADPTGTWAPYWVTSATAETGVSGGGDESWSLFELDKSPFFDLLEIIDQGACIISAEFEVELADPGGDIPQEVRLYGTEHFDPTHVYWNVRPGLEVYSDRQAPTTTGPVVFDAVLFVEHSAKLYFYGYDPIFHLGLVPSTDTTDWRYLWWSVQGAAYGAPGALNVTYQEP